MTLLYAIIKRLSPCVFALTTMAGPTQATSDTGFLNITSHGSVQSIPGVMKLQNDCMGAVRYCPYRAVYLTERCS